MRFLQDSDGDDPLLSVVNLIDVFLVVVAMLMIIIVQNPLNPFAAKDVVVVENPGKAGMRVTVKDGEELIRYETTGEIGEGHGVRAGVTYRLPDGRLIYVPEPDGAATQGKGREALRSLEERQTASASCGVPYCILCL